MEKGQGLEHIGDILSHMQGATLTICENLPNPPFESPIERVFAESCFKYLSPTTYVEKQVGVSTAHGDFRLDFLMSINDRKIAIECDGKDFHEVLRDELRDAILLGGGHCHTVYHFRGRDLVYYPYDCVWLMSVLDRDLFSLRGHLQLEQLRSLEFDLNKESVETKELFLFNIDPPARYIFAVRRSTLLSAKNPTLNYFWKDLYRFVCEYPNASIDELLDICKSEWKQVTKQRN